MPSSKEVGEFVDKVAGKVRTPASIAGRLLEETVEVCQAAGLSHKDIMAHVMDAIHNQCSKAGKVAGHVIYPGEYNPALNMAELIEEIGDIGLLKKDLCYAIGLENPEVAEDAKWAKFITRTFNVAENGTIYAKKS